MVQPSPYALAVDVGTSSLKAVLYADDGVVLGAVTRRYTYRTEQAGWAEADPEGWWTAFEMAVAELRSTGFDLHPLKAVAFTGQMHTAVLLDAEGRPLDPTILWLDRRAAAETAELVAALQLPPYQLNSTYTLPKLVWLKRHRPEVVRRVRTLLWPKDYLRFRLTGDIGTDTTEPGGAALLNWDTLTWATERLDWTGLAASTLPPIRKSAEVVGHPLREVAERLGLAPEAAVIAGVGDVAALISGAPPKAGRVVSSLGSSSMVFAALADDQRPHDLAQRLYTYPLLEPYRLFGGVSSTTGAALVWAFENLVREASGQGFAEAMTAASKIEPGAGGLCFIPYLAGERSPYWNDELRAGFYGFRLSHDRHHLLRAVMESIAFSLRHLLDIYEESGVPVLELALAGGGTKTPGLCQIIADVCQKDVAIYTEEETVTRVLYALCRSALARENFATSLLTTFPQPDTIRCNPNNGASYRLGYETYRRFVDFAVHEAARAQR
jgi:xylulokinase